MEIYFDRGEVTDILRRILDNNPGIIEGLDAVFDAKVAVQYATSADLPTNTISGSGVGKTITLTGLATWSPDGSPVVNGDRILVRTYATATTEVASTNLNNGFYLVSGVGTEIILTRSTDFDGNPDGEVHPCSYTFVEKGSLYADTGFMVNTDGDIIVDTTPVTFVRFATTAPLPIASTAVVGIAKIASNAQVQASTATENVSIDGVLTTVSIVLTADNAEYLTAIGQGTSAISIGHALAGVLTVLAQSISIASANSASTTGDVAIATGNNTAGSSSGNLTVKTGTTNAAGSGSLTVATGAISSSGTSGALSLKSGVAPSTGTVEIGSGSSAGLGSSGNMNISTGGAHAPGDINLTAGNAATSGTEGGDINATAGTGYSGRGGHVTLAAGQGGTSLVGGNVSVSSGAGGPIAGDSGDVDIKSANEVSPDNSGDINISSGTGAITGDINISTAAGNNTAGDINITGGASSSGEGSDVNISSGSGPSFGGDINLTTGAGAGFGGDLIVSLGASASNIGGGFSVTAGNGASTGGAIALTGGNITGSGVGGAANLTAGSNVGSAGPGGAANIKSGNASAGDSGNILVQTGTATGTRGTLTLDSAANQARLAVAPTGSVPLAIATTGYVSGEIAAIQSVPLLEETVTQTAHGFSVLNAVFHNGTIWALAKSDSTATLGTHIVTEVINANSFKLGLCGRKVITSHGLTVDNYYFVSDTTAGTITATEPTSLSSYSNPIVNVVDANTINILNWRPSSLRASLSGSPSVDLTIQSPYETSSNYTILDDDTYTHIYVTTGGSAITITLPTLADNDNRIIRVYKADTGAGTVIIDGEGSEPIGTTALTRILYSQGDNICVIGNSLYSQWIQEDYLVNWRTWAFAYNSSFVTHNSSTIHHARYSIRDKTLNFEFYTTLVSLTNNGNRNIGFSLPPQLPATEMDINESFLGVGFEFGVVGAQMNIRWNTGSDCAVMTFYDNRVITTDSWYFSGTGSYQIN